ncbi:MAG: hypothetical protein Q8P18_11775 [Pseudomonadota bacterium]|nr:hypothetical protein [Pseudomonadota bacterium]
MSWAVAALTVLAVALTPGLPWFVAPAALGFAVIAAFDRHWIWTALGATLLWAPAVQGPMGAGVLAGAIVLGAQRWRVLSTGVIAVGLVVALKQEVASVVLPSAIGIVAWLVVTMVTAAGAVSAARGGRIEAAALFLSGAIVLTRLALVWTLDGEARLLAARQIGAVDLVYGGLVADADEPLTMALLRAEPNRDEAALRLGWERAIRLGWRPARADGVVVPVARALDAAGRGGEALRLLAQHPRTGEVDALRAILERTQGVPCRWRGAPIGPLLPGRADLGVEFDTNGWVGVEFTAMEPLAALIVTGTGVSYAGAPLLEVQLDRLAPVDWVLDGPAELTLGGPIEPGPHRLGLRFMNDRVDGDGDRNVEVLGIRGE